MMPFPASAFGIRRELSKSGVLLALDGRHLTLEIQTAALKQCVQLTDRLDILLVNPTKAPTLMLGSLLLRLEHSGIDYRLASAVGNLGVEIVDYLLRFRGITLVVTDLSPSPDQTTGSPLPDPRLGDLVLLHEANPGSSNGIPAGNTALQESFMM